MKKYKLVNGEGWGSTFKEGIVYEGDYSPSGVSVEWIATKGSNSEDWREVVDNFTNAEVFTNVEVVTLITFLNDNFEQFRLSLNQLNLETYMALPSLYGDECERLIDKIEANDTNLTEAEKITLINFLNDNFEEFRLFTEVELDYETYADLYFDGDGVACPLINKIERL